MTKILRMTMVQTITIDQIMPASSEKAANVGPIIGEELAALRKEAEDEAAKETDPGIKMVVNDVSAEVIEV